MAEYHCSVTPISRSTGRSATGAAAYRAGEQIVDARTGLIHDYRKKQGVVSAEIVAPADAPEWATNRELLWNAAEAAEKRKDACVAREYVVALPHELDAEQRRQLALDFARQMVERHGFAADVCIHKPSKDGDQRNHHAHIMTTTRQVGQDGLGAKCAIEQAGRKRRDDLDATRALWAEVANKHLEMAGRPERIDHRTLAEQGIDRAPTKHLGPAATEYERRTGEPSRRRLDMQAEQQAIQERLQAAQQAGEELRATYSTWARSSLDLRSLERERDQLIESAIAAREALYERYRAGPDGKREIELAGAYGLRYDPTTAAEAVRLQAQVDSRMRSLDEFDAKRAAEAAAPKPTLAELIQQPQRAPEPAPAPVPKVDTPRPQGTDLGALLGAGNRAAGPSEPLPSPTPSGASGGFPGARRSRVPTGSAEADAYVLAQHNSAADQIAAMVDARANAEPVRWHEYEADGERYRRDAERARDARRVEWLHDGTGEWHSQPQAVIDQHAGRRPEPEQQAQEQKPRDLGRSM